MKTKNILNKCVIGASLLVAAGSMTSAHAGPILLGAIGLFGPQGEAISYEKKGDQITIRQCAKNSLKSDMEGDGGCQIKSGTSDVTMSVTDFRSLAAAELARLKQDSPNLSDDQKALLDKYLASLTDYTSELARTKKNLKDAQAAYDHFEQFKKENPKDFDAADEKDLGDKLAKAKDEEQCIEDDIAQQDDIKKAKSNVDGVVESLITAMDGHDVKKVLRNSENKGEIGFNLLKQIVSVETCDVSKTAKAQAGYICQVKTAGGSVLWKAESDGSFRDLKSGIVVSKTLGQSSQYNAANLCPKGMTLPTGYPTSLNAQNGNKDSDFVTLEKDGVRQVAPGMTNKWFWSSSVLPNNADHAYDFNGYYGYVYYAYRDYFNGSVLCVGR